MEKKIYLFGAVFIVVAMCTLSVLAFDPMGTPTAGLKHFQLTVKYPNWTETLPPPPPPEGQFSVGFEYMYSNIDIRTKNISPDTFDSATIDNIEMDKIYTNIGMGLTDDWEIFVRLGTSDARIDSGDRGDNEDNFGGRLGDSDFGFAIGGGTKITFAKSKDGKLKWGVLAQMMYSSIDFDSTTFSSGGTTVAGSPEGDLYEVQVAAGPTYILMEGVSVYGGPFLDFIGGTLDVDGTINGVPGKFSADLREDTWFGGYVGAEIDIIKNMAVNAEFQSTGDDYAIGGGVKFRF